MTIQILTTWLFFLSLFLTCHASNSTEYVRRRKETSSLLYLALGTSNTWGSGIGEENPTPFTYPALMGSTRVKNLGSRASGPGYPAVCLQTMVGDSPYRVIIIEYMLRADEGLGQLAHRVRHRFPQAVLIFLDVWYPRMVSVIGSGIRPDNDRIGLKAYQNHLGFKGLNDPDFINHLQTNPHKMIINHRFDLQAIQRKIARSVSGYVWHMPMPTKEDQVGAHVAQLAPLFSDDFKHLSKRGHAYVARGLKRLLRSMPPNNLPTMTMPMMNPWSCEDSCASWFLNGKVPHEYGSRIKLIMFDEEAGNYALEVDSSGGSLILKNPFLEPATLYFSYMATGEPRQYPKTRVTVGTNSTIVDPVYGGPDHTAVTTKIGILQPGSNAVQIQPLETFDLPFRLVATSITQFDLMLDLGLVNIQAIAQ